MLLEKVIGRKLYHFSNKEECKLQIFTLFLAVTFLLAVFSQFWNQHKILRSFWYLYLNLANEMFLGHISTFLKL